MATKHGKLSFHIRDHTEGKIGIDISVYAPAGQRPELIKELFNVFAITDYIRMRAAFKFLTDKPGYASDSKILQVLAFLFTKYTAWEIDSCSWNQTDGHILKILIK